MNVAFGKSIDLKELFVVVRWASKHVKAVFLLPMEWQSPNIPAFVKH